jgi:hypothetical protein
MMVKGNVMGVKKGPNPAKSNAPVFQAYQLLIYGEA